MGNEEIRWGILGSANITATEVGPAMARSPRNRVVAVGSRQLAHATEMANSLGSPHAFGSYEEVLADEAVTAVYIPLPNSLHTEWAVRALKAGKNVLCEKPLAMTVQETREIIAAADLSGKVLLEGFMYRFHPRIARVRRLLDSGTIGEVRLVRATYTFEVRESGNSGGTNIRLNRELGGGALTDLGSYCCDGLRLYANSRPSEVFSRSSSQPGGKVETRVWGDVTFHNGVTGQFFAALDIPGGGHVEILGTTGRIRLANAFRIRADQGPVTIEIHKPEYSMTETFPYQDQYALEIEHFTSLVLDGAAPVIPLEDTLDNALMLESIRHSWSSGTVKVPTR